MKTIKEKAEEYDRLKALVMKCSIDKYGCIIGIKPSDMFSELAESEDEKFLRYIIDCCKETILSNDKGLELSMGTTQKLLAYLEKQKETKRENEGNSLLQSEQKPEWSEEDEKMLKSIISDYDDMLKESIGFMPLCHKQNWIKSLKDRVAPQQEWGEEDEGCVSFLIESLEGCLKGHNISFVPSTALKYIEWLKSLRPQNRWKPSDEQIRPLEYAIDYFRRKKNDTTYLESLYQDLMKLREE